MEELEGPPHLRKEKRAESHVIATHWAGHSGQNVAGSGFGLRGFAQVRQASQTAQDGHSHAVIRF